MRSSDSPMQVSVACVATASLLGNVIVFSTYFVSKRWRNELHEVKKLILVMRY